MRLAHVVALAVALVAPAQALAIGSQANSSVPAHVLLVGLASGAADTTTGAFLIVIRDVSNNPVPGERIEFRLLNCPGARVAVDQRLPGVTSRCATHGILATTALDGSARMAAVGGGDPAGPHGAGPCAQVYAGGAFMGDVRVAYLDLDGLQGMGSNDLSIWLTDFGTGEPIGRSDFNGDQALGSDDLSVWLTLWAGATSVESPAAYCP